MPPRGKRGKVVAPRKDSKIGDVEDDEGIKYVEEGEPHLDVPLDVPNPD
jgi:hypothetical protein